MASRTASGSASSSIANSVTSRWPHLPHLCGRPWLHLTFQTVRAGTYFPGAGCPDGLHYDVKGNLWIAAGGLGGVIQVDPRGLIVGFVPIPAPGGDLATTNLAFGSQDNKEIFVMSANSGTFWRFKTPNPGLIGPGGIRLPEQK